MATAGDGPAGPAAFRHGACDLVITDRTMPRMGGNGLAHRIPEMRPEQPIMLTGFGELMHATGERPSGVDQVLRKPPTLTSMRVARDQVQETGR